LQLDLSAAFDTIGQNTLKPRLDLSFGISGCALQWLSSWLNDRFLFVSVGGRQSKTMACEFGVPQESVLAPLQFSLYMSPIVNLNSGFGISHSQYADDTRLYISLNDERALSSLSDCFESVHWWFTLNGLSLNPDKSEAIIIDIGARQRTEGSLEVIDPRSD
jgi:Reverse transcriptase (RNA-dependent DNA polymerase)